MEENDEFSGIVGKDVVRNEEFIKKVVKEYAGMCRETSVVGKGLMRLSMPL